MKGESRIKRMYRLQTIVADPKLLISDPDPDPTLQIILDLDPTLQVVSDPDQDPCP